MSPQYEELRNLPLVEKLRIVEQLWDDISASDEPFPLQAWHKEKARRRAADLVADPDSGLTRKELWQQVDRANG